MEPRIHCETAKSPGTKGLARGSKGPHGTMETVLTLWDSLEPRGHYSMAGPHGIKGTTVNTVGLYGMKDPL